MHACILDVLSARLTRVLRSLIFIILLRFDFFLRSMVESIRFRHVCFMTKQESNLTLYSVGFSNNLNVQVIFLPNSINHHELKST